jgi:hypothetical protein
MVTSTRVCPMNARLLTLVLLFLFVSSFTLRQPSFAQDSLPPLRQLIADTLAMANANRDDNAEALSSLAEAQAYLGEFAAARETLGVQPSDFRLTAALWQCAQIEVEQTGSVAAISDTAWKLDPGTMRCKAALAFIERGEIDNALQQIDLIAPSAQSPLGVFGVELIQKLKLRNAGEASRKVALAWASRLTQAQDIAAFRLHYDVPQLVVSLIEFNEREVATALCQNWHSILKTDIGYQVANWAEYARAIATVGDKDAARSALAQAYAGLESQRQPNPRKSTLSGWAQDLAKVAAREQLIFGADAALAAYNLTYEFARRSVDPKDRQFGEFAFQLIVAEQLMAGDDTGARETIKHAPSPRTRGMCWTRICSYEIAKGNDERARSAARAAFEELNQDGFEPFVAEDMALVASNAARADEKEIAQRLFGRAIGLSEASKPPKAHHPFIASFQVHGGLLNDAYHTIQSITKPSDRSLPLAHLCRALAKAQYEASKRPK